MYFLCVCASVFVCMSNIYIRLNQRMGSNTTEEFTYLSKHKTENDVSTMDKLYLLLLIAEYNTRWAVFRTLRLIQKRYSLILLTRGKAHVTTQELLLLTKCLRYRPTHKIKLPVSNLLVNLISVTVNS